MAYVCEIGPGTQLYLDNQASQTLVTLVSQSLGQQQQSRSGYTTGPWTSPPTVALMPQGCVITVFTAQGDSQIQVQGSAIAAVHSPVDLRQAQQIQLQHTATVPGATMPPMESMRPMQPMEPMNPMPPMQMGNSASSNSTLSMSMNPMTMRMGTMSMQMSSPPASSVPSSAPPSAASTPVSEGTEGTKPRQFCSQCGAKVAPADRFCSQCGHRLT